ncbi:MAG: Ldh family oxidoreductase [Alphaproteobacteria bacterium]|nr:Ldh family oxidoreductase [Alphaproteobacteria bacterium]
MKQVEIHILKEKLFNFLMQYFDEKAVQDCVDVILYAELCNKTGQGLLKLLGTEPLQGIKPEKSVEIFERTKLSALISGNKNPSFHIAQTAMRLCIDKAKEYGFGIVGANGIFSSTGALGFYAEKAAQEGLIAYACARSPGATAPFGLSAPLFGTNPFSWAFPTLEEPVVFDMATSAITFYELVLAKMAGKKIPEDVAIDREGEITTDPSEAMKGGILPFDKGYKGSALSMMVETLSGPLVGASYCDYETFDKDWGFLVFAFDPELLIDAQKFRKEADNLVTIIRQNGGVVPGDNSRQYEKAARHSGNITVEKSAAELLGL